MNFAAPSSFTNTSLPGFQPATQLLDMLERATGAGAWMLSLPDRQLTGSVQLARLLQLATGDLLVYAGLQNIYACESQALMTSALAACIDSGLSFDEEVQIVTGAGHRIWVRSLAEAVRDSTGQVTHIQGMLQDLSAKKLAEQEFLSVTMRLGTTLASMTDAFVTVDRQGCFTYANQESQRLLGHPVRELLGLPAWEVLQGGSGRLRRAMMMALNSGENAELEEFYVALGKWLELRIYPFEEGLAVYLRDVTDHKVAKDEIEHLAFHDPLTQLPNRQLLMERLGNALSRGAGHDHVGALMFIDLDHFKVLNDTLGHFKGDMLLQNVATRLRDWAGPTDTVARLGGDEFVVMLEDLGPDLQQAKRRAGDIGEKLLSILRASYDLAGYQHHATCSIGITCFANQGATIGDLLKQADLAMYQAKAMGRDSTCFFDPRMQAFATANAAINLELRQSLRDGDFVLHYQPQVGRDGRMTGVEALVRWQHPKRGLVAPESFIAQAEESGLILPLGGWVLETACAQLACWSARPATAHLSMAVNVSVRQFRHPEFVDTVMKVIEQTGIRASQLKLELTESLLARNIDVSIARMSILKAAGVTLALDDFGIGYSALSYLKRLPLDQLKIDRSFVRDVLTDPNDAAIARTIIGFAQSLGLDVMAEGVETEAQRAFLAWSGCECYQGFLFCKPLPIDELELFMAQLPPSGQAAANPEQAHLPL